MPPLTPPDVAALTAVRSANSTLVQVQFRSSADIRVAPAGVHRVQVSTVNRTGPLPRETVRAEATLPTVPPRANPPAQVAGAITRGDPDAAGRYLYEAFVPLGAQEVLVRLIDPLGRASVLRLPLVPDLVALQASSGTSSVSVSVKSNSPITAPQSGVFLLEVFSEVGNLPKPTVTPVASSPLHTIPTVPIKANPFVRSGPDADGRFTYSCAFGFSPVRPSTASASD